MNIGIHEAGKMIHELFISQNYAQYGFERCQVKCEPSSYAVYKNSGI
jgi:hypothetical protein